MKTFVKIAAEYLFSVQYSAIFDGKRPTLIATTTQRYFHHFQSSEICLIFCFFESPPERIQVKKFLFETNCRILQGIYAHYWPDFYLFGYSMEEYQQFADGGRGCTLTQPVNWSNSVVRMSVHTKRIEWFDLVIFMVPLAKLRKDWTIQYNL